MANNCRSHNAYEDYIQAQPSTMFGVVGDIVAIVILSLVANKFVKERQTWRSELPGQNGYVQELDAQLDRLKNAAGDRQRTQMQKREALEVVEKAIELKRAAQEKIRIEEESAKAEAPQQADERRVQAEESLRRAECLLKEAEERTRAAEEGRERAEVYARRADEERLLADRARLKAEDKARRAEDARAKAEMEQRLAEEAKAAAEERCRRAEEDGQRSEAERAIANEEAQRARAERDESEAAKSAAVKAADEARMALEEAQRTLSSVMIPTHAEYKATRARLQCQEDFFHFAVAGASGSGKSSLINALRGLRNGSRNPLVAKTSVTDTTNEITRYADPDQANPFVWYEVPDPCTLR